MGQRVRIAPLSIAVSISASSKFHLWPQPLHKRLGPSNSSIVASTDFAPVLLLHLPIPAQSKTPKSL
jgi:hypothetical protein